MTYFNGEKSYWWDATTDLPLSAASLSGGVSQNAAKITGTVTTTSGGFSVPANANRVFLKGQNPSSTASIAFDEFNGTAVLNSSWTVPPLGYFTISTPNKVNFIASASTPIILTEASSS